LYNTGRKPNAKCQDAHRTATTGTDFPNRSDDNLRRDAFLDEDAQAESACGRLVAQSAAAEM